MLENPFMQTEQTEVPTPNNIAARLGPPVLVGVSLLVIAASLALMFAPQLFSSFTDAKGQAALPNAEVIFDRPLQALHDHNTRPGDPNQIPFLPEGGPQPALFIAENFYEFGSVGAEEAVTHDFFIVNQGNAPLTITRAYSTCGCTTAEISASLIPPGKAAKVTLRFDAGFHDVRGQAVRRGIVIESNDPNRWQSEIWIQASVGME